MTDCSRWRPASVALLALLLPAAHIARAAGNATVLGGLPTIEGAALSPDGTRVALVRVEGDRRTLLVLSTADSSATTAVQLKDAPLLEARWVDARHLALTVFTDAFGGAPSKITGAVPRTLLYDLETGKSRDALFIRGQSFSQTFFGGRTRLRRIGGETVLVGVGLWITRGGLGQALVQAPMVGPAKVVPGGGAQVIDWVVDDAGLAIAIEEYDPIKHHWNINMPVDAKWQPVLEGDSELDRPSVLGLSPDGKDIWVSQVRDGRRSVVALSATTGKEGSVPSQQIADHESFTDTYSDRVIAWRDASEPAGYHFFGNGPQARWYRVMATLPGHRLHWIGQSDDFMRWLVLVENEGDGPTYVFVDLAAGKVAKLGYQYEGLHAIAEVRPVSYKASDGLQIEGFLTLPPGKPAKGLPLVVMPHGGPASADSADFDWFSQALAAQGYAVLQPNFRGSSSNWALMSAGFGEWGRKMQTDLSDGVAFLASEGVIDARRVCVVGASYGGYAALAGVALQHDIYRCAVSIAGIADLRRFQAMDVDSGLAERSRATRYWERFLGTKGFADPVLEALSPNRHAAEVAVPLLLVHGDNDRVVPFEQSQRMADAMAKAHKPVSLVRLPAEDHYLSHARTRQQALQAMIDFLREHNPPDRPPD